MPEISNCPECGAHGADGLCDTCYDNLEEEEEDVD